MSGKGTGQNMRPAALPCKFFQRGTCALGSKCRFEHVIRGKRLKESTENPYNKRRKLRDQQPRRSLNDTDQSVVVSCVFFQRGKCKSGNKCHYEHVCNGQRIVAGNGKETSRGKKHEVSKPAFNLRKYSSKPPKPVVHEARVLLGAIKSDMKKWSASKMWPLSCYSFLKHVTSLDGLEEYSAEEARLAFHDALALGKIDDYLTRWSTVCGKNSRVVKQIVELKGKNKAKVIEILKKFLSEVKRASSQPLNLSTFVDDDVDMTMQDVTMQDVPMQDVM